MLTSERRISISAYLSLAVAAISSGLLSFVVRYPNSLGLWLIVFALSFLPSSSCTFSLTDSTGGKLEYTDLVEVARHGLISFFLNALVIAIFLFFLATS